MLVQQGWLVAAHCGVVFAKSYTGSLAPGEFHATQRGVQGALLSVQGHPMGGFCLCWTETLGFSPEELGLLSPCRY